ncbi:MAG: site-specific DNA-methyltransferase [Oscillospiraceae bacterium]|nr:site-specific DNA-methyltransferase [Oscillospiraceae bacterium]
MENADKCEWREKLFAEDAPQFYYAAQDGGLCAGDCRAVMRSMRPASADLIFADPPYSLGKADWDSFASADAYLKFSMEWISEASRVLKPTGTLYVCGFSEILADLRRPAMDYFHSCRWIVWHYKNKANLGRDWGRSHESILCLRKSEQYVMNTDAVRIPYNAHTLRYPARPQAETSQYNNGSRKEKWVPNPLGAKPKDVIEIPTTCNGMGEKTPHPTQKPEELLRKMILASSNESQLVLDPFVGSGTTAVCARQLNRAFFGIDQNPEYLEWAVRRLQSVKKRSIQEWMDYDRRVAERREAIR